MQLTNWMTLGGRYELCVPISPSITRGKWNLPPAVMKTHLG